ncbi:bifunctional PIG-L family deacetylase/class I SAM-dependent methyltransferase [Paenarthrobacter sp. Z7-10]|uniref:PIG-L family deacetylase n=1 Tax=Paenarthrobacter sp. Z7-10 TaxID=2787635 RepID=UPI0022A9943C|nr:bifunctional PIG-L family deacetylase/class I SAM-dependent methyltransferase [Paenarthrobacter sp. Z7-10]MCZ2404369.1 bifunctional PIG-L family deacetylase/class I SAM-dependent methyltransferase [Paenarthrobacter sp. Z7-10]
MVTFSHLDRGTPEQLWLASPRLRCVPTMHPQLDRYERLVLVSAHPDDETLAAAGLLQAATQHGLAVRLVVATLGEASHPHSVTHTQEQLAAIRREELDHAISALVPSAVIDCLSLPDGQVSSRQQDLEQAVLGHCSKEQGKTLIVAPWRGDGHTDHAAAGAAAAAAAGRSGNPLLEYPVWMWHWGSPEDSGLPWAALRKLNLGRTGLARKNTAISCHFSQISALSDQPGDEALLAESVLVHFRRPYEVYIDSAGVMAPVGTELAQWASREFDAIHQDFAEPWQAPEAWYEKRKRQLTLAMLPREKFAAGLEIGCSTGVLTQELAERCTSLLGVDLSAQAVRTAMQRTAELPGVSIAQLSVPQQWPPGTFDLIVLSEVGYYFTRSSLQEAVDRSVGALRHDGVLLACHWRHPIEGWPLDGDAVHGYLRQHPALKGIGFYKERDFVLEAFALTNSLPLTNSSPQTGALAPTRDEP